MNDINREFSESQTVQISDNVNIDEIDDSLMGLYDDNDLDDQPEEHIPTLPTKSVQEDIIIESILNDSGNDDEKSHDNTTCSMESSKEQTQSLSSSSPSSPSSKAVATFTASNDESLKTAKESSVPTTSSAANATTNVITHEVKQTKKEQSKMSPERSTPTSTIPITNNSFNNHHNVNTPATSTPITQPQNPPSKQQYNEIEALNDEIATLLLTNKITLTTSSKLQAMLRENVSLKEKNTKLKSLLSRSSKVSKETKVELDKAQREVTRLTQRVEALANRPTHMDLLADFETNFDRALMNLHSGNGGDSDENHHSLLQQSGEDTRGVGDQENVSTLLLTELSQTKARMENLETLNKQLAQRATFLGKENQQHVSTLERQNLKMSNLQLELRMAKMETENATREVKAKTASLAEMQMEIDLVTRSAMDANARVAVGVEFAKSIKSDQAHIEELKAKVAALQEWAVASAEAKEVILEENKLLEKRVHELEKAGNEKHGDDDVLVTTTLRSDNVSPSSKGKVSERKLWTKSSSLVIGAGTSECRLIELGENQVMDFEIVILRWKFDLTPSDLDIVFSILKGRLDNREKNAIKNAHSLVRERRVIGGGGGEVEGAFVIQNACTFVFSNEHSWVRPRTIKYEVEAFAIL